MVFPIPGHSTRPRACGALRRRFARCCLALAAAALAATSGVAQDLAPAWYYVTESGHVNELSGYAETAAAHAAYPLPEYQQIVYDAAAVSEPQLPLPPQGFDYGAGWGNSQGATLLPKIYTGHALSDPNLTWDPTPAPEAMYPDPSALPPQVPAQAKMPIQPDWQSQGYPAPAYSSQFLPTQQYAPPPDTPPRGYGYADGPPQYRWIILPGGLLYKSYLAGVKEARFSAVWLWEKDRKDVIWETTLGGRVGILRYGTPDNVFGEGFQFDMEGAAFPRVIPGLPSAPLEAVDFRFGLVGTWRWGALSTKIGYYHISAHAGDEFLIANPGFVRLNYVRDSFLAGLSYDVTQDVRLYGEFGYAFNAEDGALPLEFQFGAEYSPLRCNGFAGAPFGAINGHVREDFNWIASVNLITGWQWRGEESSRRFRVGMQVYSGPSLQYEFVNRYERLVGIGLWYDY